MQVIVQTEGREVARRVLTVDAAMDGERSMARIKREDLGGASRRSNFKARTMAAASVVLPVPAEPRITMTGRDRVEPSVIIRANVSIAPCCAAVGS